MKRAVDLSEAFLKVSFEEIENTDASETTTKEGDKIYSDWQKENGAQVMDAAFVLTNILRERYPKHSCVRVSNPWMFPVLQFPDMMQQPLPDETMDLLVAGFTPFLRRTGRKGGLLNMSVNFGGFMAAWHQYDFIIYHAVFPMGMYKDTNFWVLHQGPTIPIYEFLSAVGTWFQELHEEILVFEQGMWTKDGNLYQQIQKAHWEDVILNDKFKTAIRRDISEFFKSEAVYKDLAVPWKRGLLFYGPAGNGKTISLKAAMHETDKPILYVRNLISWMGEEYAISMVFGMARAWSPCILVFEDLDSLINMRNRSYFLNQVDGVESNDGIMMIATTNHLEQIDGSVYRPSRFDRQYLFDIPDEEERRLYCAYWQNKLARNDRVDFPDKLADEIAKLSDTLSFAYLKEAFVATLIRMAGDPDVKFAENLREQVKELKKQVGHRSQIVPQVPEGPSMSAAVSELGSIRELLVRMTGGDMPRGLTTETVVPSSNLGLYRWK